MISLNAPFNNGLGDKITVNMELSLFLRRCIWSHPSPTFQGKYSALQLTSTFAGQLLVACNSTLSKSLASHLLLLEVVIIELNISSKSSPNLSPQYSPWVQSPDNTLVRVLAIGIAIEAYQYINSLDVGELTHTPRDSHQQSQISALGHCSFVRIHLYSLHSVLSCSTPPSLWLGSASAFFSLSVCSSLEPKCVSSQGQF